MCFFLTSSFIEQSGNYIPSGANFRVRRDPSTIPRGTAIQELTRGMNSQREHPLDDTRVERVVAQANLARLHFDGVWQVHGTFH